jgi:hypothetical protein
VWYGFIWLTVWFGGGLLNPVVHLQFPYKAGNFIAFDCKLLSKDSFHGVV